jgi:hypothetical protein
MQERVGSSSGRAPAGLAALTLGAVGRSPLCGLQSVFFVDGGIVHPTNANVYGVV